MLPTEASAPTAPVLIPEIASRTRKKWIPLAGKIAVLAVLIVGVGVGVNLTQQRQNLESEAKYTELAAIVANVTDESFSIWWTKPNKAEGCVTVSNVETGQQQTKECDTSKTNTHLITLTNLTPGTPYQVSIQHGQSPIFLSPFWGSAIWTRSALKTKPQPNIITGKVVSANQEPVANASVFIAPDLSDKLYLPVTVSTDESGNFFADVSILDYQSVPPFTDYFVEVTDRDGIKLLERTYSKQATATFLTINVSNL